MSGEIVVPKLGESVTEATVSKWFKKAGEAVTADEPIVELETDKVTMEVNAPASGMLKEIKVKEGQTVEVGALLGTIEVGAKGQQQAVSSKQQEKSAPSKPATNNQQPATKINPATDSGPAVSKMLAETGMNAGSIPATGKDGRLTKGDVLQAAGSKQQAANTTQGTREERVRMSKLRQVIAKRLKDSQNTAAILTTFNEIDMSSVMALRNEYKEAFEKKHGQRLGFMGFFIKAAVAALKELPAVNAQIDGDEIVYKNYYDIGVAVGTDQGLVVPVIRNCDQMNIVEIEAEIARLAKKARDGALAMEDLQGGTFTITNGGVYGSLMATPIINPPQSGILGMHKVEERPIAKAGQVVIRPMMYVALSYDHRIIDGKESVTFLVRVKEGVEDPRRLMLGL